MTIDWTTIATWIDTIDSAISIIGAIIAAARAFTAIARRIRSRSRTTRTRRATRTRRSRGRSGRRRRNSHKGAARCGSWMYQPRNISPRRSLAVGFLLENIPQTSTIFFDGQRVEPDSMAQGERGKVSTYRSVLDLPSPYNQKGRLPAMNRLTRSPR